MCKWGAVGGAVYKMINTEAIVVGGHILDEYYQASRGVYSSIIRPKRWGTIFPLWERILSFGG